MRRNYRKIIDKIIGQKIENFEIIVIDDFSQIKPENY